MAARCLGLPHAFTSPLVFGATLLFTLAVTPPARSQSINGTPTGRASSGNQETASGSSPVQNAAVTTPSFAWPCSVSADQRRFLDQKGKVYLLKTMSSWAMAQNCTDAEIATALEGLKSLGFNAVTVSPFGVHMNDSFGDRYKNKVGSRFFADAPMLERSVRRGRRWTGSCPKRRGSS